MAKEFVIQPNCSLSDRSRIRFLWLIGLLLTGITLFFALQGMWLVGPFMGADLLLLIYAYKKVGENCRIIERVIISDDELTIYHEEKRAPRSWSFPLHWVSVDLRKQAIERHPSRLLIGSHGNWIELASFLNDEERSSLASAIKSAIINARQPGWSKS